MIMQAVQSSNIKGVGYDPDAQELVVEFNKGGRYKYKGVPPHVYAQLLEADSVGRYFATEIRNKYETEKLQEPQAGQE